MLPRKNIFLWTPLSFHSLLRILHFIRRAALQTWDCQTQLSLNSRRTRKLWWFRADHAKAWCLTVLWCFNMFYDSELMRYDVLGFWEALASQPTGHPVLSPNSQPVEAALLTSMDSDRSRSDNVITFSPLHFRDHIRNADDTTRVGIHGVGGLPSWRYYLIQNHFQIISGNTLKTKHYLRVISYLSTDWLVPKVTWAAGLDILGEAVAEICKE